MKEAQVFWAQRQKKYIDNIENDLSLFDDVPKELQGGWSKMYFKLDSAEADVERRCKVKLLWRDTYHNEVKTYPLVTSISINGLKSALKAELEKAKKVYANAVEDDFERDNCENCFASNCTLNSRRNYKECSICDSFQFRQSVMDTIYERSNKEDGQVY